MLWGIVVDNEGMEHLDSSIEPPIGQYDVKI